MQNPFTMPFRHRLSVHFADPTRLWKQTIRIRSHREQTASEKVEHAFDFIEAAFADGQELVVFVTELAMDPEAAVFLAENENERFRKYNEQLLLGTKKAELLSELREGTIHSQENVRDF